MKNIKNIVHFLHPALSITLVLMLICGLGYPLVMNGASAILFPEQANGNIVMVDGAAVGSKYVGQEFTKDYFMKSRPSAVHYNTYQVDESGTETYADNSAFTGVASGSYNYAPSNPALHQRVQEDIETFLEKNPDIKKEDIPTDLMTASGSGLDPHISPKAAAIQIPSIAEASGLSTEKLEQIVKDNTTTKLFGILGEDTVNVLGVNIDIAEEMKQK